MLCDLVNFNPSISECGNFDEEVLNVLFNLKLKAESEFNYDVDNPFVIKDTLQSKDQTSSSTIAQNKENNFSFNEDSVSIFKSFLKEQIDELRLDFENKVNRIKQEINGSVGTEMYLTSERLDIFSKKIKHLFNKKLRYENDLRILKLHSELNTVPEQLNFNKFPEPFLKHNDRFIQKYNTLISKFQNEIINLAFYKRNLNGFVDNIDEFVENIHIKEEDNLKIQFIDSDNKARRVILKPFVVISKNSKEQPYLNTPKRESVDKRKQNLQKSASNHNFNRSFDQNRPKNNDVREKIYSKNKRNFNFNQSSNSNRSSSKNRNENLNLNRNFNDKGNGFLNGNGNAHPRKRSNSTQRNRQDTSQFNNNIYKRNGFNNPKLTTSI
ncbi:unnamed protein product [Brachionus calyciflorus]|uniref:Uncharacterized protein n=1 Tax=Brachionus calyciflorus TaxID=104777 RepID=A0A814LN40_9BILA|nr:unnamed protein product [Brachionus calyciflorus]